MRKLKQNTKRKTILFCLFLLFAIYSSIIFSSALGLSPSDKRVSHSPDASYDLEFNIVNSEGVDLDIGISVEGELAKYALFEQQIISIKANEYNKPVKIALKLPSELSPGVHIIYLKATPLFQNSGDMMQAFVSPIAPIYIKVPYPSKYADVRLRVEPALDANPIPVLIEFDNLGNEDISSASGSIYIYDQNNKFVSTLNALAISVPANTYAKTEGSPRPILKRGNYVAKAFTDYDGVQTNISTNFTVGNPRVIVYGFYTRDIYSGIINPIEFELESDWNSPLQVKAFLEINGLQSEVPLIQLPAFEKKKVAGFLDAASVPLGESEIKLTLIYADQIKTQNFKVNVGDEPPLAFDGKDRTDIIVVVAIILFIAVIVLLWLYIRKKIGSEDQMKDDEIGTLGDSSMTKPLNNDEAKEK